MKLVTVCVNLSVNVTRNVETIFMKFLCGIQLASDARYQKDNKTPAFNKVYVLAQVHPRRRCHTEN